MKICSLICLTGLMTTFPLFVSAQVLAAGPFSGVNLAPLSADQRKIVVEASEDFQAVLNGKHPVHAQEDVSAPVPADGGTTFYVGHKYSLTIEKSLSSFGTLNGYVYGPIVVFDASFAYGNESTFSGLHFYSAPQLKKLLSER